MTFKISPPPSFPSPPPASGSHCCEDCVCSSAGVSARISSWSVCTSLSPSLKLSLSQELISLINLSSWLDPSEAFPGHRRRLLLFLGSLFLAGPGRRLLPVLGRLLLELEREVTEVVLASLRGFRLLLLSRATGAQDRPSECRQWTTRFESARQLPSECRQWTTHTQRMTYEWSDSRVGWSGYMFSSLMKQNKKAKICFVIYIAGFFLKKNLCYEVIVKQKKTERSSNDDDDVIIVYY
jgi:hypothetical protein